MESDDRGTCRTDLTRREFAESAAVLAGAIILPSVMKGAAVPGEPCVLTINGHRYAVSIDPRVNASRFSAGASASDRNQKRLRPWPVAHTNGDNALATGDLRDCRGPIVPLGFAQMRFDRVSKLGRRGGVCHLGQRFYQSVFSVIQIFDLTDNNSSIVSIFMSAPLVGLRPQ